MQTIDPFFKVEVINETIHPQQAIYAAMHQDYSEQFVFDELSWMSCPSAASFYNQAGITEKKAGELIVKYLLNGNRGHFGPLEHCQIILNCGWFPHSTVQQIRTHRVGVSFDVQSFRYTGQRIGKLAIAAHESWSSDKNAVLELCDATFYLRPVGQYSDRSGKHYDYTEAQRESDLEYCVEAACRYQDRISEGFSEEHARGLIPFDCRQHFILSANVRSLMHLLDLRWKSDAQLEAQQLCEAIFPHFERWVPAVAEYYMKARAKRARLAP